MIFEIVKIGLSVLGLGFLIGAWIAIDALIADAFSMDINTLIFMQLLGILTMLSGKDVLRVVVVVLCLASIGVLGVYLAIFIANYAYKTLKKEIKT